MILVFDTETTGLAEFKLPPEHDRQPRLVQLGAILYDKDYKVMAEVNLIARPENFEIPTKASDIHGITTEIALQYGVSAKAIMHLFTALCNRAQILVAHNIVYDAIVIGRESFVQGVTNIPPAKKVCTMESMTKICALPGNYGKFKWPKLVEAHQKAFGESFDSAHDAMADVRACARVYRWLVDNKHV